MKPPSAIRPCSSCQADRQMSLGCTIAADGSRMVSWWCLTCGSRNASKDGKTWISHDLVRTIGADPQALPIMHRIDATPCERCGAPTSQRHHWAPRALFDSECDEWPTSYLCVACHRRWHVVLRTPGSEHV